LHFAAWTKREIELSPYKDTTLLNPINPSESKELSYINELKRKDKNFNPRKSLGLE
jgi:hypothetical protein